MVTENGNFHKLAAAGDCDGIRALLAAYKTEQGGRSILSIIDAPDANGFTAMFHAQMNGQHDAVRELEAAGWTKMPEGLIFTGPGGRKMFWSWCTAATGLRQSRCNDEPSKLSFKHDFRPVDSRQPREKKLSPKYHAKSMFNTIGPDHSLYQRKTEGAKRIGKAMGRPKKPYLNTADLAELYEGADDLASASEACRTFWKPEVSLPGIDEATVLAAEAVTCAEADPCVMEPLTVAAVARFVVARKPRRNANGEWEMVAAAEEEPALVTPLDGDADEVMSLDSFSFEGLEEEPEPRESEAGFVLGDAAVWPALSSNAQGPMNSTSYPGVAGPVLALSDQWEILSTVDANDKCFNGFLDVNDAAASDAERTELSQGGSQPMPAKSARTWAEAVGEHPVESKTKARPQGAHRTGSPPLPSGLMKTFPNVIEAESWDVDAMQKELNGRRWGMRQGGGWSVKATERRAAAIEKRREQSATAKAC